jgi:xanthine dehydrogenase YagS FAD-binding subunit
MRAFTNTNARDVAHATAVVKQAAANCQRIALAGGGSDLVGMMKDRLVSPDVVVHLGAIRNLTGVKLLNSGPAVGGMTTLADIAGSSLLRAEYSVLAEAAESVATPQIRNVATIAGNVCQRPWCWYYRQGFACLKNGGTRCYSIDGENGFHAIFGGGPSYIVHPSDTAPALVALDATFRIVGPAGERRVHAGDFFTPPTIDAARENVLKDGEILAEIALPARNAHRRSTYHKVMDREAWTHAVVSAAIVLDMDKNVCRSARVVLGGVAPIPWRLPEVEKMLAGERITKELAAKAGEQAVAGARPLAKNGYKVPLTRAMVARTLESLSAAV